MLTFILAGAWLYFKEGFIVTSVLDHNAPSDPTVKTVAVEVGAWFKNYFDAPVLFILPALAVGGALLNILASKANRSGFAFFSVYHDGRNYINLRCCHVPICYAFYF